MCFLTQLYIAFLQRLNLPHFLSAERPGPPYLNKRVPPYPNNERPRLPYITAEDRSRPPHLDERQHAYTDIDRPRLPLPSLSERQRVPLMELDEKSLPSHNEMLDLTPAEPDGQSEGIPSLLDEEEFDDYRILLQRHRLIQQQLAALEKQENSTLGEDNFIDDSFVDIPVGETQPNLPFANERNLDSFEHSLEETYKKEGELNSQQLNVDRNMTLSETSNEITNMERTDDLIETESSGEGAAQKPFLPFKIKPRYSNVPSVKELSQKDLEQREARKGVETAAERNNMENVPVEGNVQSQSQRKRTRGQVSRARKNRRKRKRKLSQGAAHSNSVINSEPAENVGSNQGTHVDPYNELEARLMSLADSSVSHVGGTDTKRYEYIFF